ncbi:hypothetical protein BJY04DRAFT_89359 [Aspergillus karnatakaensis]|uniref:uncharacterized protein n=1 Tax=Aspergillus karnatakaensis TaxID=1810916 RepID=UPI003CCD8B6B
MAPDKKDKKRKAAVATVDSPAKKTKKVEAKAAEPATENTKSILKKKAAKEDKVSKPKANGDAPRSIKPRKRAADYMSDESEAEVPAKKVAAKEAKSKPSAKKSKQEDGTAAPVKEKSAKASKKPAKKLEIVASDSEDEAEEGVSLNAEDSEEEDDQTTALIRGFESSGDEDESADEGLDPDAPVPKIPDSKKAKKKILKLQKEAKAQSSESTGAVYVGRIPHGFYEHQMRAYFAQFGEITRLRLSRNKITGASKHYAFIEFASESVAKIVAATMDNYLMYGHILKCKFIPSDQLHPELWKGANRRFKATPWNRIEQKRLEKGRTRGKWEKNIEGEQKRRLAKAEKYKELGYDFKLPELKSVDEVPVQKAIEGDETKAVEEPEPVKAVEAAPEPVVEDEEQAETPKKSKKEKKGKKEKKEVEAVESPKPKEVAASPAAATKSKKKSKKAKA